MVPFCWTTTTTTGLLLYRTTTLMSLAFSKIQNVLDQIIKWQKSTIWGFLYNKFAINTTSWVTSWTCLLFSFLRAGVRIVCTLSVYLKKYCMEQCEIQLYWNLYGINSCLAFLAVVQSNMYEMKVNMQASWKYCIVERAPTNIVTVCTLVPGYQTFICYWDLCPVPVSWVPPHPRGSFHLEVRTCI